MQSTSRTIRGCVRTFPWLLTWLGLAAAQCDYYQEIAVQQTFYVYSPNYPKFYPANTHCTWRAVTSPAARIRLECYDFNMPASAGCSSDHVAVSQSGALSSGDAHHFCGRGTFMVDSVDNKMAVELVTRGSPYGGYFSCSITAFPAHGLVTEPPPPELPCNCGIRQRTRIVGGTETGVNEFPMMAALIDGHLRELYCGATILSTEFVLTAAHCLLRRTPDKVAVLVGDHDIKTGSETNAADLILSSEFITHPQFDSMTQVNDIALVRLSRPAVFSNNVGPACLPFRFQGQSFAGLDVIVLGWGTTEFSGPLSPRLKQTHLNVLDDSTCRSTHPMDVITDNQLCTFAVDTDACQSDSGGPLLYADPSTGRLFVVGIVSYGSGCATETPGVNTRVDSYLDWIEQETRASFCVK